VGGSRERPAGVLSPGPETSGIAPSSGGMEPGD
jgi:hypothetical protein